VRQANELKARLLELERYEEALIERAEREGLTVDRRVDADARAVLNLVVVDPKAATQALAA
jgi:hypothetical protein